MKNQKKLENYYRISQADILAVDTLIEYLQYGVLALLKAKPLQSPNEDSVGLDEYEAYLSRIENLAKKMSSLKTNHLVINMKMKENL